MVYRYGKEENWPGLRPRILFLTGAEFGRCPEGAVRSPQSYPRFHQQSTPSQQFGDGRGWSKVSSLTLAEGRQDSTQVHPSIARLEGMGSHSIVTSCQRKGNAVIFRHAAAAAAKTTGRPAQAPKLSKRAKRLKAVVQINRQSRTSCTT